MKISDLLETAAGRRPVFSFEFFPPKTVQGEESLYRTVDELKSLGPDFVSITYGAGGSTREKTIEWVKRIKFERGVETMAHLTCVGATRSELAEIISKLASAGIENILALRGDPPKGETGFTPVDGGFAHASQLVDFIRKGWSENFSIGVAGYPEKHPEAISLESDVAHLCEKIDRGADVVTTQLFFHPESYFTFVERVSAARGGRPTCPILPGIMPITAVEQLTKFAQMCGASVPEDLKSAVLAAKSKEEIEEIGVAYAVEQAKALLAGGAPGIHFYTLNKSRATMRVMRALRS